MKEQSVARGFSVLALAGVIVKILSLLYIPFLLAIIGEEGNGIYAAAYQVYVLVYVISNAGIPVAISKLVSELIAVGNYRAAVRSFRIARAYLVLIGIVMSVLMFAIASPLAKALHFEKSYLAILALSPTLLFTSVASAYRGYFQGRGNMQPTAISQIFEQVINTVFTLVFAALLIKFGLEAACAGGTIGTSLGALFSAIFLVLLHRKSGKMVIPVPAEGVKVKRYKYSQLAKKVIGYSIPITLCIGLQYAGNLIDLWNTKARLLTAGYADKGATELYSHLYKYQQLLNAPLAVTVALAATILPAISAAAALRNREQIQNRVNFALRACFLITIPSAVGMSVLSTPIFKLLKYGPGAELMMYGSIALVLLAIVQIQTSILQGAGKLYTVTFNLILGIIGKIATNYFLISIPEINIKGAIIGSIVGYCIPIILSMIVMKKALKAKSNMFRLLFKPAVAAGFMGVIIYFTYKASNMLLFFIGNTYFENGISTAISIFTGAALYFVILVFIRGITNEDFEMIPRKISRFIPEAVLQRIM